MIAVVTGSSGFIASHLVDALLARGAEVRALVRPDSSTPAPDSRVSRFEADLLDDRSVRVSPVWEGATHVFHLAGITKARTFAQFRAGNVFPTANVLAALAARDGAKPRVVLVSSQAAAGPASAADTPVREDDRPTPVEAYGRSKLQAEQAAARYRDTIPVAIIRPAAVYGPRDRDFLGAFRQATHRIALHAVPRDNSFFIVHVADVVQALLLAAEHPDAAGRTYFIANDEPITWRTLYDEVARAAESQPRQLQVPLAALRAGAVAADLVGAVTGRTTLLNRQKVRLARPHWWHCDASRAHAEMGWTAQVPLQQGLRDTYLWYVQNGWLRASRLEASGEESKE